VATDNPRRLAATGPIDPANGFPLWFEDGQGLRLEIGLRPDPLTPAIGELPMPGAPPQFPDNFPDEAFYFMAEARLPVGGNGTIGRARVILALEAAFGAAGEPKPGFNIVFARMRVRIDDVIPDASYVVTHPYGETGPLLADERGRVFYTEDFGIAEGDVMGVLKTGPIAPFLTSTAPVQAGYIGDGVSEHRVTGSPFNTNFVRIVGPRIGEGGAQADPAAPADPDRIWTDLFTVQGRIAKRVGAAVGSATYAVKGGQTILKVHARSIPAQSLELVGSGLRVALKGGGPDYVGIASVAAMPGDAELVNVTDSPPTHWPVRFTDEVIVDSAVYDADAKTLTVAARSSDPAAVLTVPALGLTLSTSPETFPGLAATPPLMDVVSDKSGSDRRWIELKGTPLLPLGVEAHAAATGGVVKEAVVLDGSGSRGATAFRWSQSAGPNAALADATTAKASFTPDVAGVYDFSLTVEGAGGPQTAAVSVTIGQEPGPDALDVARVEYRTGTRQFRLSGTVTPVPNEVIATMDGVRIGRAAPDITGAWSIRRVLKEAEIAQAPAPGATVEIASKRTQRSASVRIRN
jgi:hypothetical protein